MTPEEARALFLPIHGVAGVLALVGGFGALLVAKGSPAHRWLGRLFALSMAGATLAAAPVILVTENRFLAGMGAFAAYMTFIGWRIGRQKERAGGRLDQAVALLAVVGGLGFAIFGASALLRGHALGLVPVAMGLGAALFARVHLRWFRGDRATRRRWVAMHLGAIGGGLIAGLTAFSAAVLTNYLPSVPEPLVWLAPTALLSPLLQRASKRYG